MVTYWMKKLKGCFLISLHSAVRLHPIFLSTKDWLGTKTGFGWVSNVTMQHTVLQAMHSSPVGGHSCFPVTYHRVKQLFAWTGMKKNIQYFVASCELIATSIQGCFSRWLSLLVLGKQQLLILSKVFLCHLETTLCLVVVDKFSKYEHFIHHVYRFHVALCYCVGPRSHFH